MTNRTENDSLLKFGDESALWTFGSEEQNTLGIVSKVIASTTASEKAEKTLQSIIETAEDLERLGDYRQKGIISRLRKDHTEELYRSVLKRINSLVISLRLRQAELAKDITVLDKAYALLEECIDQLEHCLLQGRVLLQEPETQGSSNDLVDINDTSAEEWRSRFSARVESLELSRVIALQTIAQIQLMKSSKQDLMQKLQNVVQNVIPLWRNQVSLFLGLRQVDADNESVKRIGMAVSSQLKRITEDSHVDAHQSAKKIQGNGIDIQALMESSAKLLEVLGEIRSMEEDCSQKSSAAISTLNGFIVLNQE